jgi:hypothetical protein
MSAFSAIVTNFVGGRQVLRATYPLRGSFLGVRAGKATGRTAEAYFLTAFEMQILSSRVMTSELSSFRILCTLN